MVGLPWLPTLRASPDRKTVGFFQAFVSQPADIAAALRPY
jgi:hypothetical protein